MNKKIKQFLIVFALGFLALSCEKEENKIVNELAESPLTNITFEDFTSRIKQGNEFEKLVEHLDFNTGKFENKTGKDDLDNAIILTDQVVLVEGDDINTYTFNLSTERQSIAFYNLILETDNEGEILGSRIMQYVPDENWLADMSKPFSGNVGIVKNNAFDVLENNGLTANGGDQCIVFRVHFCDHGGTEHPQGAQCTGNISFVDVTICPVSPLDDGGSGPIDPTGTPVESPGDGPVIGGGGGLGTTPIVNPCGGDDAGGVGIGGQNGECYDPPTPTQSPTNPNEQFEDQIINQLEAKASGIYWKLLRQTEINSILLNFLLAFSPDQYDEQTITLRQEEVLRDPRDNSIYPEGVRAYTWPFPESPFYEIVLRDSAIDEGSDVEVALLLIHEFLHATLLNHQKIGPASFREIFEDFTREEFGRELQHAIFAEKYLWPMARTLSRFDNNKENLGFYYIMAHIGIPDDLKDPNVTQESVVQTVLYFRNRL